MSKALGMPMTAPLEYHPLLVSKALGIPMTTPLEYPPSR